MLRVSVLCASVPPVATRFTVPGPCTRLASASRTVTWMVAAPEVATVAGVAATVQVVVFAVRAPKTLKLASTPWITGHVVPPSELCFVLSPAPYGLPATQNQSISASDVELTFRTIHQRPAEIVVPPPDHLNANHVDVSVGTAVTSAEIWATQPVSGLPPESRRNCIIT